MFFPQSPPISIVEISVIVEAQDVSDSQVQIPHLIAKKTEAQRE